MKNVPDILKLVSETMKTESDECNFSRKLWLVISSIFNNKKRILTTSKDENKRLLQ